MNSKRALGVVGVLIALMLALTGCVKLNMSVKVNNEKSVDYEVVYAIQKSVLGEKSFDEFMESNGTGSRGMDIPPDGATVVDYEDEKYKASGSPPPTSTLQSLLTRPAPRTPSN